MSKVEEALSIEYCPLLVILVKQNLVHGPGTSLLLGSPSDMWNPRPTESESTFSQDPHVMLIHTKV